MTTIWILGAPDPEMAAVEATLAECGQIVAYATVGGRRVTPATAYRADGVLTQEGGLVDIGAIALVECGGPALDECRRCGGLVDSHGPARAREFAVASGRADGLTAADGGVFGGQSLCGDCHLWPVGGAAGPLRCDHHNSGDAGYGRPPAEFLPASSLGQVISQLARMGVIGRAGIVRPPTGAWATTDGWPGGGRREWLAPSDGAPLPPPEAPTPGALALGPPSPGYGPLPHWFVGACRDEAPHFPPEWRLVPARLGLTAAADHCPAAAYAGQCPGVDPLDLAAHRNAERAAWLASGPGDGRDGARQDVAGATPQCPACRAIDDGYRGMGDPCQRCGDGAGSVGTPPADLDVEGVRGWARALGHAYAWTADRLRRAPEVTLAHGIHHGEHAAGCDGTCGDSDTTQEGGPCGAWRVAALDLRAIGTLPELPEVLARTGRCAIYRMVPLPGACDSRVKVGIIGAGEGTIPGPAPVRAFLDGWAAAQGLVGLYGDPARGFAGGYEP